MFVCAMFVCLSSVLALAGGKNFFYQSSGTSDYGLKFGSKAQGFSVLAGTEDIVIYACMGETPVDTIYIMGGSAMSVYCPCDSLRVDRTSATVVYINPTYNPAIFPSMTIGQGESIIALDSLVTLLSDELTDNVTLVDGSVIPASGKMTVSVPLQPVGNHKTVTFSIITTGTPPDSLYYQIVAAPTMMDSLTVLNIGTLAAPVLTGVIVYPLDASPFHSTGIEIATGVDWSSLSNAKFTGMRLHPDDSHSWTGKVVCNLK